MTDPEARALEAKLDTIIVKLGYIEQFQKDHEQRIRSLERWKLSLPISMVLILVSALGVLIGKGGL